MNERERDAYALDCDRCGQPAEIEWVDVHRLGDPGPQYAIGATRCPTPGCYHPDGSRRVELPPGPGELTREDRTWLRDQQRLIKEASDG